MCISGYNIAIRTQVQNCMSYMNITMRTHTVRKDYRGFHTANMSVWEKGGIEGNISTFRNVDLLNCKKDTLKT